MALTALPLLPLLLLILQLLLPAPLPVTAQGQGNLHAGHQLPHAHHHSPGALGYRRLYGRLGMFYAALLDFQAVADQAAGSRSNVIGNIAWHPHQVMAYAGVAVRENVSTICEIGYGAGHSTMLWLIMNPSVTLYTFDTFSGAWYHTQAATIPYIERTLLPPSTVAEAAAAVLAADDAPGHVSTNPPRWVRYQGLSTASFGLFQKEHPGTVCDVVHVDGGHLAGEAYADIVNFKSASGCNTVVLLDDINASPGPGDDYKRAVSEGVLQEVDCVSSLTTNPHFASMPNALKKFCVARYKLEGCQPTK